MAKASTHVEGDGVAGPTGYGLFVIGVRGEGHGNCLLQNNPMQSTVHGPAVGNRVEDRRVRDGETLRLLKAGTWAAD
jgi:hypothetical protein